MRAQARHVSHDEEEESAFISMTDMTVGFLFIIMILLAFFASQIRDQDVVPKDEYDRMVVERDYWLDQSMTYLQKIEKLIGERDTAENERDILAKDIEEAERKLISLNTEIEEKKDIIEMNNRDLSDLEASNLNLRQENQRLLDLVSRLHDQIEDRDLQIKDLKRELLDNEDTIKTLEKEKQDLLDLISDLQIQLEDKDSKIEKLNGEIADLRAKIEKLEAIDPLEEYLALVAQTRREILTRLRDAIRLEFLNLNIDLKVDLSEESDALRFQGEGLFASGSSRLTASKLKIVESLGHRLDEVLPCFTIGDRSTYSEACNPSYVMIEAVQIEGHTDNVGDDRFNRTLSTNRANSTFFAITEAAPAIREHLNLKNQPVISVAAYGPDRPVATNDSPEGKATNRRIDLRFIMVTPQDTNGIEVIRAALSKLHAEGE